MASSAPTSVVGEALIDIVRSVSGRVEEHVGGSPANVAIGLARLGHPVRLATRIGDDERGRRIAGLLASECVELAAGSASAARTSTAEAELDAAGVATYQFDLDWKLDLSAVHVPPDGHLHTGSIGATLPPGGESVLEMVRAARNHSTVSYDPNCRPTLMGSPDRARPVIEEFIALSDVVKASAEDVEWLYRGLTITEALNRWAALGPPLCVVTQGSDDVLILAGDQLFQVPTARTHVVDTVGAGDSFMAGLVSSLLDQGLLGALDARGRLRSAHRVAILAAVRRALACARITVSRAGADPPRRSELQQPHPDTDGDGPEEGRGAGR